MKHHEIKPNTLTSFRELLENEYIGGWDLKDPRTKQFRDFTLTIASVEEFRPRKKKKGERVRRFVLCFVEAEKPWLAGPASGEIIKGIYGAPATGQARRSRCTSTSRCGSGRRPLAAFVLVRARPRVPAETWRARPVDEERAARLAEVAGREPRRDDDAQ